MAKNRPLTMKSCHGSVNAGRLTLLFGIGKRKSGNHNREWKIPFVPRSMYLLKDCQ